MYRMHLQLEHYKKIALGSKRFELRLLDEKRKELKVGDIIQFYNNRENPDLIDTKITALHKYSSFSELCDNIDYKLCGFETREELLETTHKLYPIKKQIELGVLGIEIERI